MDEESDSELFTTEKIMDIAVTLDLLPEKSKKHYLKEYEVFMKWRTENSVKSFSEKVLLAYFYQKSKSSKSSTLWSSYSKLKSMLNINNNIDIGKYLKLITYLKKQSIGYKPKKSKTFTQDEINTFLLEAPDELYLMFKVVLILGVAGACRREELYKMEIDNVEDKETVLVIKIKDSKTHLERQFAVIGKTTIDGLNLINIYKKYISLRPKHVNTKHLFLQYRNGKCSIQTVGINMFSKIPSMIAKYLKLSDPLSYTGHSFRRTSAAILISSRDKTLHGGGKSTTVAEEHLEDLLNNKIDDAVQFLAGNNQLISNNNKLTLFSNLSNSESEINILCPDNSVTNETSLDQADIKTINSVIGAKINIINCNNCTFKINILK